MVATHVRNACFETTCPVANMWPCQRPHSSAQRMSKLDGPLVLTNAMLSTPGTASALTPSW